MMAQRDLHRDQDKSVLTACTSLPSNLIIHSCGGFQPGLDNSFPHIPPLELYALHVKQSVAYKVSKYNLFLRHLNTVFTVQIGYIVIKKAYKRTPTPLYT